MKRKSKDMPSTIRTKIPRIPSIHQIAKQLDWAVSHLEMMEHPTIAMRNGKVITPEEKLLVAKELVTESLKQLRKICP
jgi:hypothetical protein